MSKYDALVLDTQGSELLVLKGAAGLLPNIKYVQAEVADFESYSGACRQLAETDVFSEILASANIWKKRNFRLKKRLADIMRSCIRI